MSEEEQYLHKESLLRMDASSPDGADRRRLGLANPPSAFIAPQALNVRIHCNKYYSIFL